jgi:hypothetical protein
MPDLGELDSLEIVGHTFEIIHLAKVNDYWCVQMAVDGIPHEMFYEPAANVDGMTSNEFETYMKAQALGAPVGRK